ncbi:hypothetical protein LTR67_007645 [Exophiala xenobiotica]
MALVEEAMAPGASSGFPSADEVQQQLKALSDTASSYDASPEGHGSRMRLIGQAQELIASLTDPSDMGFKQIGQAMELVATRALLHIKAFQHIPSEGSISLSDLAAATKCQEAVLERLLRMLVCTGFVRQLPDGQYAHTKFSRAYAAMPGPGLYFQLIYDESFLNIDNIHLFFDEKGWKEPVDQRYSPYAWKAGQEGTTIWEIMAQNPARFKAFQAGIGHASASVPLTGFYNFSALNTTEDDRPVLVDVGGGNGRSIMRILQAHPDLPAHKFVLQDLPEVVKQVEQELPKEVKVMAHDFFTPQPVKGAKAYFFRWIMHDYSDPVCIDILKQIVPAMAPDSVILTADLFFPSKIAGPADIPNATMDMVIFNMAGKERAQDDFKKVFEAAGLEFVKAHRLEGASSGILEARLPTAK